MNTNFNINKFFKDHKIISFVILFIVLVGIMYLIFNGNHNKIGPIETNIPLDSTYKINENNKIKIDQMNGDILTDSATKNEYYNYDTTIIQR